jgi:hypothetical protein
MSAFSCRMGRTAAALLAASLAGAGAAEASCTPVHSEVVSIGQKAARLYSERSLKNGIDAEQRRLGSVALSLGKVTKTMTCVPYPNLLGADEWRCVGEAKVCAQ